MSGWNKVRLGEISTNIQTGPFGSQLHQSDYEKHGLPVIMPKDIVNGSILESGIARVGELMAKKLSRHKVALDDIVYPRRGDVAKCTIIGEKENGWLCGTGCLKVTIDKTKALPLFVYYQLQTPSKTGWIEKHTVGATMPNLNTGIIGQVPIELPTLNLQVKIVSTLSAYDNLIDNYRRQIKLLEEAAQRLYKEWFVDFHFPGYEQTKIVDGVPEGWRKGLLGEIINIYYGKDHKKVPLVGNIPVYGSGGLMRMCNKSLYSGESVLIPRKGSLNNIMYVNCAFWTVDTMFFTSMKISHCALFVYFFLKRFDMYGMNIGSAVPSMTTKVLNSFDILIPCDEILCSFDNAVQPLFQNILKLQKLILLTQEARDRLLPKLMSGEIKV